jgi:hypothetical protein
LYTTSFFKMLNSMYIVDMIINWSTIMSFLLF